jgi:hypothetical protein
LCDENETVYVARLIPAGRWDLEIPVVRFPCQGYLDALATLLRGRKFAVITAPDGTVTFYHQHDLCWLDRPNPIGVNEDCAAISHDRIREIFDGTFRLSAKMCQFLLALYYASLHDDDAGRADDAIVATWYGDVLDCFNNPIEMAAFDESMLEFRRCPAPDGFAQPN